MTQTPDPVPIHMIGEASARTRPGEDPGLFGTLEMHGPSVAEVRSYQTFRLVYTCGKLGIDDTGGIRIALRKVTDAGLLQVTDPTAANYVSVHSSGEGRRVPSYDHSGGQRPWSGVLTIKQQGGYLKPGETIEIVIGDTTGGGPGFLLPTFADGGYVFRPMADVQATGVYEPLPDTLPAVRVVAGPVDRYKAALPTMRRPGEGFHLGIKAEDAWGNPTDQAQTLVRFSPSRPVDGLPAEVALNEAALTLEGLTASEGAPITIYCETADGHQFEAGPLVIEPAETAHFWGDLHGQTGETIGTNTVEHYFDFARNKSFLDVSSHQANDFQINKAFWAKLNGLTAELNEPGRFTVLPGYEWSGNTAVGGDHNVYYRQEGAPIYRCSHALLADRSDADTDAHTLTDLYAKLRAEPVDAIMYAHVGGRYANIHYDHDPMIEAAVEVHSAWGSFEWILTDGFPMRRRVGVVANSDGHKGRPGSSYPGASYFGAYGGLTCFQMPENTRDAVFDAIRARRTYGTSGPRVYADVVADLPEGGTRFDRNPMADPDTGRSQVAQALMGDIVRVNGPRAEVAARIHAPVGIEWAELRRGIEVLAHRRTYGPEALGQRIRVMWSGAEYRGRGRNTVWSGRAQLTGARIAQFDTINRLNPEAQLTQTGSQAVVWKAVTTGNRMGFDIWMHSVKAGAALRIDTNRGTLDLRLDEIGWEATQIEAGGLDRKLWVQRMPDAPLARSLSLGATAQVAETGDTPIWLVAGLEDGNQLWTSPMYLFRDDAGARASS